MSKNGVIIKYFHDAVTQADADLFGHKIGSCEGQQTWECLALLVGARLWEDLFANRRVSLRVRGDNVGMLTLVVKLRPGNRQQAIVARELALVTSRAAFPPAVYHTPGIAHKVADLLSRIRDPKSGLHGRVKHEALLKAHRCAVPERSKTCYRALQER